MVAEYKRVVTVVLGKWVAEACVVYCGAGVLVAERRCMQVGYAGYWRRSDAELARSQRKRVACASAIRDTRGGSMQNLLVLLTEVHASSR